MANNGAESSQLGLYIHIPFCRSKCRYCDFNSFAGLSRLIPAYLEAVRKEMVAWSALSARGGLPSVARDAKKLRLNTIYLGGGTPTLLGGEAIAALLSACRASFQVEPDAEITVEANPGTIDVAQLRSMLVAGANRLSIGVQSFNPNLLPLLGRNHTRQDVVGAYRAARKAGFDNVSLDLMYGIPTETLEDWEKDLEQAVELEPDHLSLYGLSVEQGTALWAEIDGGRLASPDPDLAADMYIRADEHLSQHGYDHYEISNWARPGRRCRHNLLYWRNLPYIGVGAGAHSSFCSVRLANVRDPAEYIARLTPALPVWGETRGSRSLDSPTPRGRHTPETPAAPSFARSAVESYLSQQFLAENGLAVVEEIVDIDQPTQMAETAMLNLRLSEGIDEHSFCRRFGADVRQAFGREIEELENLGLLAGQGGAIVTTPRGRLLGNEVFIRILSGRFV
ncbi:MAG: radical SAM family heme chaperone HemW [Chloroflexi bacterium]|nr:radical SAM family heme chaperone HemW [Chloroflexota bacterium]